MRQQVEWFANQMENKLMENDHKGGWVDCDPLWLLKRLREEVGELERELFKTCSCRGCADCNHLNMPNKDRVVREAADVANFAMMIADVVSKQTLV